MSIDTSIEASMTESIMGIFEASIGVSVSTGYNWGTAGSEVRHYHLTKFKFYTYIMAIRVVELGVTKSERFLPKHQHTQKEMIDF